MKEKVEVEPDVEDAEADHGKAKVDIDVLTSFVRTSHDDPINEAEKVKMLALLKALREEMNQPVIKGLKVRDFSDIFVERYNFFLDRASKLFPKSDFGEIFQKMDAATTSLEKIRLEISMMIAYVQNDIMDIIEQSERLKEKNKWLQDRLREFEIKIAGIQAIK